MEDPVETSPEKLNPKRTSLSSKLEKVELNDAQKAKVTEKLQDIERNLEKSLEETPVNVKGVYLSVVVSFVFIVLCMFINKVERVSWLTTAVKNYYEQTQWNVEPNKYFADIENEKDLDDYLRHNFFQQSFNDEFMNYFNYIVGVRFTLKLNELQQNPFEEYQEASGTVRKDPNIEPGKENKQEFTQDLNIWTYEEKGGFKNGGGYTAYFMNMDLQDSLYKWRVMRPFWLDPSKFSSMAVEVIIHNHNQYTTLYYYQIFERTSAGNFKATSGTSGIFPEIFEVWEEDFTTIATLFVIYAVGLVLQVYKLLQNLLRSCKTLWTKLKLDIVWHEYIEIISVVLVVASISLFLDIVVTRIGKVKLPLTQREDLDELIDYAMEFRAFVRVTATAVLLMAFKVIVVLKNKFPSFGVLFDTIGGAKRDIINFSFITLLLMTGFALAGYLAFGKDLEAFSTLGSSFLTLFDMILGVVEYDDMKEANEVIAPFFFIVFMALFFFILLNTFLAIVLSTYIELRNRDQLLLQAKATLIKEDSQEFLRTVVNLLLCRIPNTIESDAIKYQELSSKDHTAAEQEAVNEELRKLENSIKQQSKQSIAEVTKYNIGQLSRGESSKLLTREQYMDKLKNCIQKIEEEKLKTKIHNQISENDVDYNFGLVKEMVIYLCFILVAITVALMRFRIGDSFKLFEVVQQTVEEPYMTYYGSQIKLRNVNNDRRAYEYLRDVFVPLLEQEVVFSQNHYLGEVLARATLRRIDFQGNNNPFSKEVINFWVDPWVSEYSSKEFVGSGSNKSYPYVPSGTTETFQQEGGFVFTFKKGEDHTELINQFEEDRILDKYGKVLALEWVWYNPNLNLYTYNYLTFDNWSSGQLDTAFYSYTVELDIYQNSIIRAVFELLFVGFTFYYCFMELRDWWGVWHALNQERQEKEKKRKLVKQLLKKFNGASEESKGCGAIVGFLGRYLKSFLKKLVLLIWQFIRSVLGYLQKDPFNILDSISIALSFIMVGYIIQLTTSEFTRNFELPAEGAAYIGEFDLANKTLISLRNIAAYNCLILFLRQLQFFKFSKKLSLLTDILESAKLDILFFIAMFMIVLFAYALMGYLLLGHYDPKFLTVSESLVACYNMLLGEYDRENIELADQVLGSLFFVTFMILFNLILLNMFIAIVGAHFENIKEEEDLEVENSKSAKKAREQFMRKGFFGKILHVIKCKLEKKEKLYEDQGFEEHLELLSASLHKETQPKLEVEDFEVQKIKNFDYSAVSWMKILEKTLFDNSSGDLHLPNFKRGLGQQDFQLVTPARVEEVCFVSEEIWVSEPPLEKLRIWKQLTIGHSNHLICERNRAIQTGAEMPDEASLSPKQQKLWEVTSREHQLSMWIGRERLDDSERVALWNSTTFSKEKLNPEALQWNFQEQRSFWSSQTHESKLKIMHQILQDSSKVSKAIRKSKEPIKLALSHKELLKDTRLMLWVTLSVEDKSKLNLYINEPDSVEADMLSYMILTERKLNVFSLDEADELLSKLVDSKLYDKLSELCSYQAEVSANKGNEQRLQGVKSDISGLEEYKSYLKESISSAQEHQRKLKRRVMELERKLDK